MKKRGFTLIELLVVIAIIGILASIVLVSLGTARNKAKDAAIKADLSQVRTVAEMEYIDNSSYAGVGTRTDYTTLTADIVRQGGTVVDEFSATGYCVESILNAGAGWCVDYTGYAGASVDCEATNYNCQ